MSGETDQQQVLRMLLQPPAVLDRFQVLDGYIDNSYLNVRNFRIGKNTYIVNT